MARRMDTMRTSFEASSADLSMARFRKKRSQRSCLDCRRGRVPDSTGTGGFNWPGGNLAVRTKPQTDLIGGDGSYLYCFPISVALDWPAGGTRPQPMRIEIKTASQGLTMFPSATGELN